MANKLQLINIPQMTMDDNREIHIETKKKEQNNIIEKLMLPNKYAIIETIIYVAIKITLLFTYVYLVLLASPFSCFSLEIILTGVPCIPNSFLS